MGGLPIECYTKEVRRKVVGRFEIHIRERTKGDWGVLFFNSGSNECCKISLEGYQINFPCVWRGMGYGLICTYLTFVSIVAKLGILSSIVRCRQKFLVRRKRRIWDMVSEYR